MKVLIVFNHPAPYKVDLFNVLNRYVDLDVIFERKEAKNRPDSFYSSKKVEFNLLNVKGFGINIGDENYASSKIKNYIKRNFSLYDLIIMNGYSTFAEMSAINFMKKNHIPYVLLINGGIINKKEIKLKRKIKTHYIKGARYYLSPGLTADEYLIYYGADKDFIRHYQYSSIHEKDIIQQLPNENEIKEIRNKYDLPDGKLFICPNQFIPRKNNLSLIKQFLNKSEKLLLIGNGPEKDKYIKFINENHMENVLIKDFVPKDQLLEMIRGCDGLISFSKKDIYGHSIVESLACGLPVICTNNIVSAKEIIKNGINGYIIDEEEKLFDYIALINELDRSNCLNSVSNFTIEKEAKTFADIFEGLK